MKPAKRYSTQESRPTYQPFAFSTSASLMLAFRFSFKQNRYPAKFPSTKYHEHLKSHTSLETLNNVLSFRIQVVKEPISTCAFDCLTYRHS